jgi:hypothetical protein
MNLAEKEIRRREETFQTAGFCGNELKESENLQFHSAKFYAASSGFSTDSEQGLLSKKKHFVIPVARHAKRVSMQRGYALRNLKIS